MTWIVDLDADRGAKAIVRSICAAGSDIRLVRAPDSADVAGVVVCSSPSHDLHQLLATTSTDTAVIVVSSAGSLLEPWALLAAGAADLVIWDDDPRPVKARLDRLYEVEQIIDSPLVSKTIIGRSPALRRALRELVTVARFGTGPILILGETGTGKDLAARVAHSVCAGRGSGEMVVVDCTTIVPTLAGSELFGHERGAFTGASSVRTGACAAANGGTLFLDEVGDLPLDLQPELLRVVQEGTYKRVGADTWLRTTFRLICATNRMLDRDVAAGRFRADFYYRIVASTVTLPPLRDRDGDLVPLFKAFFAQVRKQTVAVDLTPTFEAALRGRAYAGNLRDLRQLAHRVAARHVGPGPLTPGDFPPADRPPPPLTPPLTPVPRTGNGMAESVRIGLRQGMTLRELREHVADLAVTAALEESGGNVRAAATKLGVTDRALHLRRAQRRT
jgi:transcriptional regulator with GAF, ATPase, and Fis domain